MGSRLVRTCIAVMLFLLVPAVWGQQTSVAGTVTDSQGSVKANATVNLSALGGGSSLSSKANANGIYVFPSVEATDYRGRELRCVTTVEKQLSVLVGQVFAADIMLPLASATFTVEVTARIRGGAITRQSRPRRGRPGG